MNQKLLINLLLLVLITGLGLVAWLQPGKQEEQLQRLTERTPEQVRKIRIEHPDGRVLSFERQPDAEQWRMTAPYRINANAVKLNALARVVEAPILSEFPLPRERLGVFGLDKRVRLLLDGQVFDFGGNDPINHHRYIGLDGRLLLTVDRFYHHLSGAAGGLVSPALLPPDAEIQSIQTPDYRLILTDKGWRLEPSNGKISADQLSNRVSRWRTAQALSVRAFDKPQAERQIEIGLANGAVLRFLILRQKGRTWLVRPEHGLGYQLPQDSDLLSLPKPDKPDA